MSREHSRISPSALSRIMSCPASLQACDKLQGYEPPSDYAEAGSAKHDEWYKYMTTLEPPADLDPTIREFAQECRNVIEANPGSMYGFEDRFNYTSNTWGHPDFYLVNKGAGEGGLIVVGDLKTGYEKVSPIHNEQLLGYATYIAKHYDMPEANCYLFIGQDGDIKSWNCSGEERKSFEVRMLIAIDLAESKDGKKQYNYGDWCQFCKAKATCKEHLRLVKAAGLLPKNRKSSEAKVIATILENKEKAIAIIKAAEERGAWLAKQGKLPGWTLEPKLGNRKWIDEEQVKDELENEVDIYDIKLKSPAQLEKLVGKDRVAELSCRPVTGDKLVKTSGQFIEYKE